MRIRWCAVMCPVANYCSQASIIFRCTSGYWRRCRRITMPLLRNWHVWSKSSAWSWSSLLTPSPITWKNLSDSIRVQILKTSQNLEYLDQVSPQESCLKSSEPQDPQPVLITIPSQTLHHPGRSPLHLLQLVYILPVVRSPCLHGLHACTQ